MKHLKVLRSTLQVLCSILVLSVILYLPRSVFAANGVNKIINFQGKVTNANGTNVTDGAYDFVIKIYDGAGSGASTLFTETWSSAALWSSTMSSAPTSGGESLTYSTGTNESTIKVGQILWNTTKKESVIITSIDTGTNVIGISPTRQAWAGSDTVTNRMYVKDGVFKVAINSLNANISGVNFGTDTIFMGVEFNGDGEMKPRIQYTATPYAMNAEKVNGLTVTNTSDNPFGSTTILKIGDGKTVQIDNGLRFTGTDGTQFTFPNATGTVVTTESTAVLTNKSIGSGGLVFTGADSDISTTSNQHFSIMPNGTGNVGIGTTLPDALFHVLGSIGTIPVASFSANSSFSTVVFDNKLGDLFTASASGLARFTITNGGGIMLGTSVGTSSQCLLGGATASWGACGTGTSQWDDITGGINYGDGNVGIGNTDPRAKLDVVGTASVSGQLNLSGATAVLQSSANNTLTLGGDTTGNIELRPLNSAGAVKIFHADNGAGGLFLTSSETDSVTKTGRIKVNHYLNNEKPVTMLIGSSTSTSNNNINFGGGSSSENAATKLFFWTGATNTTTIGTTRMAINNLGQVGIGIEQATPLATLELRGVSGTLPIASVSGQTSFAALIVDNSGTGDLFTASSSGLARFSIKQNGNVGIGTTVPDSKLVIAGSGGTAGPTTTKTLLTLYNSDIGAANNIVNLAFAANNSTQDFDMRHIASISAVFTAGGQGPQGKLTFSTRSTSTTMTEKMRLDENGRLGIGTTGPLAISHIVNNASVSLPFAALSNDAQVLESADAVLGIYSNEAGTFGSGISLGEISGGALTSKWFIGRKVGVTGSLIFNNGTNASYSSNNNLMALTTDGNVGIGTTTPNGKLNVTGAATGQALMQLNGTGDQHIFTASQSGVTKFSLNGIGTNPVASIAGTTSFAGLVVDNTVGDIFTASASGLTRFVVKNSGNVGIGLSNPEAAKFTISDSSLAPGVDMALISATTGITTNGVDGLQIDVANSGSGAITNSGLTINVTSNNTNASSILYGLNVGNLSSGGESSNETALNIGTGWDKGLVIESGGSTNSGLVYTGAGRPTKTILLTPEYTGAILTASGSATTDGDLTSDASNSASLNYKTYFQWASSNAALQDYTIAVRVLLPKDFSDWDTTSNNALKINFNTALTTADSNKLDVIVYNASSGLAAPVSYRQANKSATDKTWTTVAIDRADLIDGSEALDANGEILMIYLKMYARTDNYVQLGDIELNYLAAF